MIDKIMSDCDILGRTEQRLKTEYVFNDLYKSIYNFPRYQQQEQDEIYGVVADVPYVEVE